MADNLTIEALARQVANITAWEEKWKNSFATVSTTHFLTLNPM